MGNIPVRTQWFAMMAVGLIVVGAFGGAGIVETRLEIGREVLASVDMALRGGRYMLSRGVLCEPGEA